MRFELTTSDSLEAKQAAMDLIGGAMPFTYTQPWPSRHQFVIDTENEHRIAALQARFKITRLWVDDEPQPRAVARPV